MWGGKENRKEHRNDEDERGRERENDDEHRNPKVGRLSQKLETCQDLKERKNVLSFYVCLAPLVECFEGDESSSRKLDFPFFTAYTKSGKKRKTKFFALVLCYFFVRSLCISAP